MFSDYKKRQGKPPDADDKCVLNIKLCMALCFAVCRES